MKSGIVLCLAATAATIAVAETKTVDDAHTPHYAVVDKIPLSDGGWDYAMIDANARRLYLGRDPGVMALDLDSKKITDVLVLGEGVHAGLPVGDTGLVVATNGAKNTATVFEGKSGQVKGSVPTGKMPDAAAYDSKTGLVAIMNHLGGTVTLIDPRSSSAAGSIPVGGELEFAVAPGDGSLYVNVANTQSIAVLDLASKKKLRTIKLAGCEDSSGLAYDAADDLLIAVCGNGVTKFVHAKDGADIATLKTGKGSDAVMFDAQRRLTLCPQQRREHSVSLPSMQKGSRKSYRPSTRKRARAWARWIRRAVESTYPRPRWVLRLRPTLGRRSLRVRCKCGSLRRNRRGIDAQSHRFEDLLANLASVAKTMLLLPTS